MSTVTQFTPIAERSDATPGLFNSRFQTMQDNIVSMNADLSTVSSAQTLLYYAKLSVESGIATPTDYRYPWYNPKRYGAVGNNVANDGAAIQGAIYAASATPGATVALPPGTFKYTSALTTLPNVGIVGAGAVASVLAPSGCDGLTINWYGGSLQNMILSNFGITGSGCTTKTAILNTGTSNAPADELDGVTIERLLIQEFGDGINIKTIRNITIADNWLYKVTRGIIVNGQTIGCRLANNYIVGGGGPTGGASSTTGITVTSFNYSVGGVVLPESVHLEHDTVFGFATAVNLTSGLFIIVDRCDLQASVYGLEFTGIVNGLWIRDSFVEVDGGAGIACIQGHSLAASLAGRVTIDSNTVISTGTAGTKGIVINDVAGQYQDNVTVSRNFSAVSSTDIQINNGNNVEVIGNYCTSAVALNNLVINGFIGPGPVYVDRNSCVSGLLAADDDLQAGKVIFGTNLVKGVRNVGPSSVTDGRVLAPALRFGSELSLGWYRSGQATMALSYGTLDLAPNAVRLSMRTLAASSITASAAQTNVRPNEVVFTIGGASGASLIIMSGGTAYGFNSAFSAKQT